MAVRVKKMNSIIMGFIGCFALIFFCELILKYRNRTWHIIFLVIMIYFVGVFYGTYFLLS